MQRGGLRRGAAALVDAGYDIMPAVYRDESECRNEWGRAWRRVWECNSEAHTAIDDLVNMLEEKVALLDDAEIMDADFESSVVFDDDDSERPDADDTPEAGDDSSDAAETPETPVA